MKCRCGHPESVHAGSGTMPRGMCDASGCYCESYRAPGSAHVALWDAINAVVVASGGDPGNTSVDRKAIDRDAEQPTRMGAPRRAPSGEARSEILPIRVTPSERAELERRAKVAGWSLSQWIRACLLGEP